MIKSVFIALIPFAVLILAASLACVLAYFFMLGITDDFPFRKIISKITQLLLVLSIFPAMKWLNLSKEELGFNQKRLFIKQLFQGFGLGIATLLPVIAFEYQLGIHILDSSKDWTFAKFFEKAILSVVLALLISIIEEPLFRGVLLTGLRKKLPLIIAVLISSCYYAALHFLNSRSEVPIQQLSLLSGFSLVGEAFANLLHPDIRSAFLALLMVGIFLALLRTRLNAGLGLCIGCHTAWVWQIKMSKNLLNVNEQSEYLNLVSTYDGVIGPLVTIWLMLAIGTLLIFINRHDLKQAPR